MQPDKHILQKELEADRKLESRLLAKELLVVLALLALVWFRETVLRVWLG